MENITNFIQNIKKNLPRIHFGKDEDRWADFGRADDGFLRTFGFHKRRASDSNISEGIRTERREGVNLAGFSSNNLPSRNSTPPEPLQVKS
jgi:hypothetical protein